MTSPGDTKCLGSKPGKAEIRFLFFGNLASTDISFSANKNLHVKNTTFSRHFETVGDWAKLGRDLAVSGNSMVD